MKQFEILNKSQYLVFNLGCGGNVPNVVNSINLIVINVYKLLIKQRHYFCYYFIQFNRFEYG